MLYTITIKKNQLYLYIQYEQETRNIPLITASKRILRNEFNKRSTKLML